MSLRRCGARPPPSDGGQVSRPPLSIRPFVVVTEQSFAAIDTFDAVFGKTFAPFFGGGVQVVIADSFFVEFGVSRFQQTGQRAFMSNGQTFPLGIPLTATITPVEVERRLSIHAAESRVCPYAAAGIGSYGYQESSDFAAAGDDVDTQHSAIVVTAASSFASIAGSASPWMCNTRHVPGILGNGGVSKDAGESDLGGIAGRFEARHRPLAAGVGAIIEKMIRYDAAVVSRGAWRWIGIALYALFLIAARSSITISSAT